MSCKSLIELSNLCQDFNTGRELQKVCVCVCVCACKREGQRERKEGKERKNERVQKSIKECKKIYIYRCSRDQTVNKIF